MYYIQLSLKILILTTVFLQCLQQNVKMSQTDDHEQPNIVYPKSAAPITRTCNATMICMQLSSCRIFEASGQLVEQTTQKKTYPTICGWGITEPRVCCLPNSKQQTLIKTNQHLLEKEECAIQKQDSSSTRLKRDFKITVVDGTDVPSNEKYPFMVGVYIRLEMEKLFLCGGSLLSKGIVLTAAHCFDNSINTDTYMLKMGSINLKPDGDFTSDLEFNVTEVIIHPDYKSPQFYNDIAILKFSGLKSYTATIRPVCLPDPGVETVIASVIGWGSTEFGGSSSSTLQEASFPIVLNRECNETFWSFEATRASLPRGVIQSVICAGDKNSSKDACQGDSGGPLVFADSGTMRWTQVGVVSGGIGCGTPGIPGIYTRISNYVDWIHSKS